MTQVTELRCVRCDASTPPDERPDPTCAACGNVLDVRYDLDAAAGLLAESLANGPQSIWRYAPLLPVDADAPRPPQPVGWSPIIDAPRLAQWASVARLRVKDEGRGPTASFKDRASAIGISHAASLGYTTVACASTGNAASSLAGLAAGMGLRAVIFIPEHAPEPKVAQLRAFGAVVLKIRGGYEAAYDLCTKACHEFGWYNRNAALNPYLVEGKKTCGLEIAEMCARDLPDWVAVSVGDGCTIAGIAKGLGEMKAVGIIDRVPRILGVQADGARPLVDAWESGADCVVPVKTHTIADSIDVGTPRNDAKALTNVRATDGVFLSVSDDAILEALLATPRLSGVFGEPAGVTGVAGVRAAVASGIIGKDASVLAVVTGNGLKDIDTARKAAGSPPTIDADLARVDQEVQAHASRLS
jgi:threonine synthase